MKIVQAVNNLEKHKLLVSFTHETFGKNVHKNIDHDDIVEAKFSNLSKNQQDSVDNIIEIIVNTVFS